MTDKVWNDEYVNPDDEALLHLNNNGLRALSGVWVFPYLSSWIYPRRDMYRHGALHAAAWRRHALIYWAAR